MFSLLSQNLCKQPAFRLQSLDFGFLPFVPILKQAHLKPSWRCAIFKKAAPRQLPKARNLIFPDAQWSLRSGLLFHLWGTLGEDVHLPVAIWGHLGENGENGREPEILGADC